MFLSGWRTPAPSSSRPLRCSRLILTLSRREITWSMVPGVSCRERRTCSSRSTRPRWAFVHAAATYPWACPEKYSGFREAKLYLAAQMEQEELGIGACNGLSNVFRSNHPAQMTSLCHNPGCVFVYIVHTRPHCVYASRWWKSDGNQSHIGHVMLRSTSNH